MNIHKSPLVCFGYSRPYSTKFIGFKVAPFARFEHPESYRADRCSFKSGDFKSDSLAHFSYLSVSSLGDSHLKDYPARLFIKNENGTWKSFSPVYHYALGESDECFVVDIGANGDAVGL